MLTTEFVAAMTRAGFSPEDVRKALHCFDEVLEGYNVTRKEANITPYNQNNVNMEFYDLYISSRMFQGYAKGTLGNIRLWLGKYIASLSCSVLDATAMDVRRFLYSCSTKKNGKQTANSTLEKYKDIVSSFYRWLMQERIITYNPAASVQSMKTPFKYQGALSSEEVAQLKFSCRDVREKLIIEFLISSGCRVAEFVNIRFKDINMAQNSVKVLGKGNKERVVYFSAEAKLLIEQYRKMRGNKGEYLLAACQNYNKGVSTSAARATVWNIYNRTSEKIHLEKLTPHTFRRTFATMALRRGIPFEQVSRLLGHSNLQTTRRYLDFDQTELQAQYFKLVG